MSPEQKLHKYQRTAQRPTPDMLARLDASPMQHVAWGDAFGYSLVAEGRVRGNA